MVIEMRKLLVALASVLLVTACASSTASTRLFVAGRDLKAVTTYADVIVVGTVVGEGGLQNIARDAFDITREHPSVKVLAQQYRVAVESVLKGQASGTIVVTVARSFQQGNESPIPNANFLPLEASQQYLLLLKRHPFDANLFAVAFEPSRFKLGTLAVVQSPWRDAPKVFPPRSTADLLSEIRSVVSAAE
jgi:hypothetical protein